MKNLILVNGTMGVGKSVTCRSLMEVLEHPASSRAGRETRDHAEPRRRVATGYAQA